MLAYEKMTALPTSFGFTSLILRLAFDVTILHTGIWVNRSYHWNYSIANEVESDFLAVRLCLW